MYFFSKFQISGYFFSLISGFLPAFEFSASSWFEDWATEGVNEYWHIQHPVIRS